MRLRHTTSNLPGGNPGAGSPRLGTEISETQANGRAAGYVNGLDGVRGIAITSVMLYHAKYATFPGGFLGVDLFFTLSAFLITTLIVRELQRSKGAYRFREFYWRRAFRLGPALVLWLALLAWPMAAVDGYLTDAPIWTVASVFYAANILLGLGVPGGIPYAHIWSLAVEEQFYLLWPATLLVAIRFRRSNFSSLSLTSILAVAVVAQLAVSQEAQSIGYLFLTGHLVPLAAGATASLAMFANTGKAIRRTARSPAVATIALLAFTGLVVAFRNDYGNNILQLAYIANTLAAVLLILHVCENGSSYVNVVLTWRPLTWLGRRSYGLYLYHTTLNTLAPAIFPGLTLRYLGPAVLLVALALAEASFRFVEHPIQSFGKRWRKTRQTTANG